MNPEYYGLVEMAFTFGVVLVFGVWQFRSLAIAKRAAEEKERAAKDGGKS